MSSREDGPQYTPESNATDKRIAKKYSPDLSTLNAIKISESLTVFITDEKLKKYGEDHYQDKYKSYKAKGNR